MLLPSAPRSGFDALRQSNVPACFGHLVITEGDVTAGVLLQTSLCGNKSDVHTDVADIKQTRASLDGSYP